ncbi:MAG: class I SAM-dependent methyltransferase [Candidatus Omnitrophica bacterium]|nr:class I SAM-dependent methyltransferase [Candidatus Omnitrophota bacterium]
MKEEDIRKRKVFNKYLSLVAEDVKSYFIPQDFARINCPACGSRKYDFEFKKIEFAYTSCRNCATLFLNPRPPFDILKKFYSLSPSTSFWVKKFFEPVAQIRREKIFRPRAVAISKLIKKKKLLIADIGAGFGLFLDELKKIMPENEYIAIEPSTEMAGICASKGLGTECCCLEEMQGRDGSFDLLTSFELAEHLYDPQVFFEKVYSLLKPGGIFLLTTLNGKGFDIQLLWESSKSISPPHHLNFFNLVSIQLLLRKLGFEIINISTPGKLDWDIVEGMIKNEGAEVGRFWHDLAYNSNEKMKQEFQAWISGNQLSSHMQIIVRRPLIKTRRHKI